MFEVQRGRCCGGRHRKPGCRGTKLSYYKVDEASLKEVNSTSEVSCRCGAPGLLYFHSEQLELMTSTGQYDYQLITADYQPTGQLRHSSFIWPGLGSALSAAWLSALIVLLDPSCGSEICLGPGRAPTWALGRFYICIIACFTVIPSVKYLACDSILVSF